METRVCNKCNTEKDLVEFRRYLTNSNLLDLKCRECKREYNRKRNKVRRDMFKDDKIKYIGKTRNPKLYVREYRLNRCYNMTIEDYNIIFSNQKGKCKICGIHQSQITHNLYVDHCHLTGKVRGLLCSKCNTALGNFNDNIDILKSAIKYLESND